MYNVHNAVQTMQVNVNIGIGILENIVISLIDIFCNIQTLSEKNSQYS